MTKKHVMRVTGKEKELIDNLRNKDYSKSVVAVTLLLDSRIREYRQDVKEKLDSPDLVPEINVKTVQGIITMLADVRDLINSI